MPGTRRLFFGVELPAAFRQAVETWRARELGDGSRPVPGENFHLTLLYLGPVEEDRLEALLGGVAAAVPPPRVALVLDRIGLFRRAGVLWLGSRDPVPPLARCARALREVAVELGFAVERRPFRPHLTLFRHWRGAVPAPERDFAFSVPVEGFVLFESLPRALPGERGVRYQVLHRFGRRERPRGQSG